MGYYINPPDMTKEAFLGRHGKLIGYNYLHPDLMKLISFSGDTLPVCLINNGPFTAAGICYEYDELDAFNDLNDLRPKLWFLVPKEVLKPYYDGGLENETSEI